MQLAMDIRMASTEARFGLVFARRGLNPEAASSWFLPRALLDDPPMSGPSKPTPTRRAFILHRLQQARASADLPALAELADRMHHTLTKQWGPVALAYAPAFDRQ